MHILSSDLTLPIDQHTQADTTDQETIGSHPLSLHDGNFTNPRPKSTDNSDTVPLALEHYDGSVGPLQQLQHLGRPSSEFHDQLGNVLYGEEYKQCVPDLQGDDLVWLVDYLDKVRCRIALPHSILKSGQALGGLDPASSSFRKCLRELRSICGARMILPTSYTLSPSLLNIGSQPVTSGDYSEAHEWTFKGSRIRVKRIRMYSKDGPRKAPKVQY
jgi:hypothetical protein